MSNHIEQKALAAGRTLEGLGYQWCGGEQWKPPLGENPIPLLDRITELEAQLADAKQVANDCRIVADNAIAEAKKYQWQPIETAPRDSLERLYMVNGRCVQGFVDATDTLCVQTDYQPWRKMRGRSTHWMPKPAAPKPLFGELVDKHFPEGIDAAIQAEGKA